jgi:hypothetical protein
MPQDPQEPMGPPLVDDPDVDGADDEDDTGPEETLPKTGVIPDDEQVDPLPP